MAMPQRDDLIKEIKRTDLLLEWVVQHGDEAAPRHHITSNYRRAGGR